MRHNKDINNRNEPLKHSLGDCVGYTQIQLVFVTIGADGKSPCAQSLIGNYLIILCSYPIGGLCNGH